MRPDYRGIGLKTEDDAVVGASAAVGGPGFEHSTATHMS